MPANIALFDDIFVIFKIIRVKVGLSAKPKARNDQNKIIQCRMCTAISSQSNFSFSSSTFA